MASNRELAERFAQTLTDHDLAGFAELLHPDYVNHNRFAQPGKDGSVAVFAAFLDAFEGFRVDTDDVLEAGDSLVGRYTYRGRHTGEFLGIPPGGYGADLLEELEGVELVPMLDQLAVGNAPDVDRVHLDL